MILLAVLLLPAAVLLYRSDRRGLRLHLLYIPLQMVASGFFAVCVMESIYNSVAGMIFYVGAIPGLIGWRLSGFVVDAVATDWARYGVGYGGADSQGAFLAATIEE
jgi:hypothetical protein